MTDPTRDIVATPVSLPQMEMVTKSLARASVRRARKSLEDAAAEVVWQIEREVWVVLGYRSWTAMREAEYGGAAFMVPSKNRPELVARIEAAGVSKREAARTAGVDEGTVRNDIRRLSAENSAPANSRKPRRTSLPDAVVDAVYDLNKAVTRLAKLTEDDRFASNRDAIQTRHLPELARIQKTLWDVRKAIGSEQAT